MMGKNHGRIGDSVVRVDVTVNTMNSGRFQVRVIRPGYNPNPVQVVSERCSVKTYVKHPSV